MSAQVAEDTSTTTPEEALSEEQEQTSESSEETENGAASDNTAGTPEEWVVPGRFKTKDDLYNSYRHAEAELTRRSQELAQLRRQTQTQVNPERETSEFRDAVMKNPVEAVRNVARSVASEALDEVKKVRFETEFNRFMQNENFRSLEPVMAQIASQNQALIEEKGLANDARLLPLLYYTAVGLKQTEAIQNAERRGQQRGERAALKKSKNQVEGASGSKGHTKPKFEDLDLKAMRKELEKGILS